ncbi:surfactin synthase thioesterase subunit [Kordia periserrulae]|uniref:Surfactin synthase thioesterase subunit n=1 Tax=Kordia periserrulae TaxID=701523 RepID=A0A2T6BZ82_9FLAO|nr:alpha/beta fold hydrolase [Kordia periserrulae]PTX61379.1 surfactin synthase thioesterase subunit [Kordia periserrulae]
MLETENQEMMKSREEQIKTGKVQLFLLHFAGGNGYSYDFLKPYIPANVEFIPLELPGRGKRFKDTFINSKKEAIQDYVTQIQNKRNRTLPYIIFGHSMGATLGLSVAYEMQRLGDQPQHLVVSGNSGPGAPPVPGKPKKGKRYLMDEATFKDELRELGGIPEEVLVNEELYTFFEPIMRSDFEILEKDPLSIELKIKLLCPIFAMMGSEEDQVVNIENWKRYTIAGFDFEVFDGNHFFIHNHPKQVVNTILTISKGTEVQH